jgi:hypothetical protein
VDSLHNALVRDDECELGEQCALNALQMRSKQTVRDIPAEESGDEQTLREEWASDMDLPDLWDPKLAANVSELAANGSAATGEVETPQFHYWSSCRHRSGRSSCYLYRACRYSHVNSTYCVYGHYMIVPKFPISGTESIDAGNAAGVDHVMRAAHDRCNHTGCVLMVNPAHHRTQDQLHLHFRHYNGYGHHLKSELEHVACNREGWHSFHKCSHGLVQAFDGFPDVFTEVVRAYGNRTLRSTGITVFPAACGGNKTIVLGTQHCSLEHSITR